MRNTSGQSNRCPRMHAKRRAGWERSATAWRRLRLRAPPTLRRFRLTRNATACVRHCIETGVLQCGDELPGIRTLAIDLVVSHNTVAKAYTELEHEGLLELRHGSGAFVSARRGTKTRAEKVRLAQNRVQALVESLRTEGLSDEEMHRLFEAELFYPTLAEDPRGFGHLNGGPGQLIVKSVDDVTPIPNCR
jgi:GntR family transcriptional regulator